MGKQPQDTSPPMKTLNMKFPDDFYSYLKTNTLIEIKGGTNRETFLKIWMVEVDHRVFARSWNKSSKSWFTEFVKTGGGQIKYGSKIIPVKGIKLDRNDETNKLINKAYLRKYTQTENIPYVKGITQPEYADYTMEFFFDRN